MAMSRAVSNGSRPASSRMCFGFFIAQAYFSDFLSRYMWNDRNVCPGLANKTTQKEVG